MQLEAVSASLLQLTPFFSIVTIVSNGVCTWLFLSDCISV